MGVRCCNNTQNISNEPMYTIETNVAIQYSVKSFKESQISSQATIDPALLMKKFSEKITKEEEAILKVLKPLKKKKKKKKKVKSKLLEKEIETITPKMNNNNSLIISTIKKVEKEISPGYSSPTSNNHNYNNTPNDNHHRPQTPFEKIYKENEVKMSDINNNKVSEDEKEVEEENEEGEYI